MADYRIRGPHGAIAVVSVPSAGLDRRTFDARVKAGEYTIIEDAPPLDESPDDGRPALNDPKSVWVAFAEACGVEVDGLTKAELVEVLS